MNIRDLYQKYQIMPQLEKHQLRVGSVGKIIAQNWGESCDTKLVTNVCLLHDMGNIVKFDLKNLDSNKFGEIKDLEMWRGIQREYWGKYGKDANVATSQILRDAQLDKYISYIEEETRLYHAEANETELAVASVPAVILMYADLRVVPKGVVAYKERIDDLKERYGGVGTNTWYDWTFWFESWLQGKVKIDLQSITEDNVAPLFDELLQYQL